MDRRHATRCFLSAALLAAACAAARDMLPLRASRWLSAEQRLHALTHAPTECLASADTPSKAHAIAIGRAAFRTPLLLGGQAARAGLSCDACHRNGRGNPDFLFPGISDASGTADVTSSLMSSHRGDGTFNPKIIPDLSGAAHTHKVSRDYDTRALEAFIRGLIVEEFDGPEPSAATLDGLAAYIRQLSSIACPRTAEQPIRLIAYLSEVRSAMNAAQYALDAEDLATARLMIASARSTLGLIGERYQGDALAADRAALLSADRDLAAIQRAIDDEAEDVPLRIVIWLATMPKWSKTLERDEDSSLFNPKRLANLLKD